MNLDERALEELIQRSEDQQSDAMKSAKSSIADLREAAGPTRMYEAPDPEVSARSAAAQRQGISAGMVGGGLLAATAFGAALTGLTQSTAFAASSPDVQMLQTSASIENLAVSTYKTALTLPYIGGSSANGVIKAFATTTMAQHKAHGQAFNSAVTALGGKAQTNPDPKYLPVVKAAINKIAKDSPTAGALAVVELAMTLENVAAETYVNNCSALADTDAKTITASIMGVEAQHVATLIAVKTLLSAGASKLIALSPMVVASLPAAAGSIGFPNAFYPISMASPAKEGALS